MLDLPSVDHGDMTINVQARSTGQIYHSSFEVIWRAPSTCWYSIEDRFGSLFVLGQFVRHVGMDIARCDLLSQSAVVMVCHVADQTYCINIDTLCSPLIRKALGKLRYASFRSCICSYLKRLSVSVRPAGTLGRMYINTTLERRQRSNADDRSPVWRIALRCSREHIRPDVSTQSENCVEVYLYDLDFRQGTIILKKIPLTYLIPIFVRELMRSIASLNATAIHQDINVMSISRNAFDEPSQVLRVSEVCFVYYDFATKFLNLLFRLVVFAVGALYENYIRTGFC